MATRIRPRLYRELLTPVLHRRFTRAAGVALIVCYAEAVLLGEKTSLFWWFPVGITGIRALLLFLSPLAVFVLRVAQLHFEAFPTKSPFETLTRRLVRLEILQTFAWYLLSAWWFGEVYIWSASDGANLGWIAQRKYWEKNRLNERPIYLRSVFFMLALAQTFIHLYYDYDRVFRPTGPETRAADRRPRVVGKPMAQLQASAPFLLRRILFRSVVISVVGPFVYTVFLRGTAWSWMLSLARIFWSMPAVAEMPFMPPYHISLLARSWVASLFLIGLWESSNAIFGAFLAQEPLKKGLPLTDASQDPNGTLVNGLQANKDVVKTFAFWELVSISQGFETRRKAVFADIDRPAGPIWNQVLSAGLQTLDGMNARIAAVQNPAPNPPPQPPANLQSLPRLAAPLQQDNNILRTPPPPSNRLAKMESQLGTIAKSYGQAPPSPSPVSSVVSPRAKEYLNGARHKLLTQGQQETLTPSNFRAVGHGYLMRFLRSSAGAPFRQSLPRRIRAIMFGSRNSSCGQVVDSIDALSRLAVASLTEDGFGKVFPDVPRLMRTYMSTITTVEGFVQGMEPHWTDVEGSGGEKRVEEVEAVLLALREGLRMLVDGFGSFGAALGMTGKEIAAARRLVGVDVEPEGKGKGGGEGEGKGESEGGTTKGKPAPGSQVR